MHNKFSVDSGVIICLCVDDILILGTDMDVVKSTKDLLSSNFDMKDLGKTDVMLEIKIIINSEGITLSQSHYVEKILKKFNHFDCDPVRTPYNPSIHLKKNRGSPVA